MQTGLIFNALISSIVFLTAVFISLSIWLKNRQDKLVVSFSALWLTFSFIWLFSATRIIFAFFNRPDLDQLFFKIAQVAVFVHIVTLGYFIYLKVLNKNWINNLTLIVFGLLGAIAVFFIFKKGVVLTSVSYFSTKYSIDVVGSPSWFIFNLEYFTILPFYAFDVLRNIFNWLRRFKVIGFYSFLMSFSVLFYILIGYFDEKGFIAGWPLMLFRLLYILALFLAYLSFHPIRETTSTASGSQKET